MRSMIHSENRGEKRGGEERREKDDHGEAGVELRHNRTRRVDLDDNNKQ